MWNRKLFLSGKSHSSPNQKKKVSTCIIHHGTNRLQSASSSMQVDERDSYYINVASTHCVRACVRERADILTIQLHVGLLGKRETGWKTRLAPAAAAAAARPRAHHRFSGCRLTTSSGSKGDVHADCPPQPSAEGGACAPTVQQQQQQQLTESDIFNILRDSAARSGSSGRHMLFLDFLSHKLKCATSSNTDSCASRTEPPLPRAPGVCTPAKQRVSFQAICAALVWSFTIKPCSVLVRLVTPRTAPRAPHP